MKNCSLVIRERSAAFTVAELMVTVLIVATLASFILFGLNSVRAKQKQMVCMTHMRQLGTVILTYSVDHQNRLLPSVSGSNSAMNETPWYYVLDTEGILPANPRNPNNAGRALWGGNRKNMMACPSRSNAPHPVWVGGRHDLHFCLNQNPGFYNRVNTSTGPWRTLASIAAPGRTFLLAEANNYIGYPNGNNFAYPHSQGGGGMNLFFFDGHGEYFKGQLPVLAGSNQTSVPYSQISPEDSFPFF